MIEEGNGLKKEILRMTEEMYPIIAEVDDFSFERGGNLRSPKNMSLLRESCPDACLVITVEDKICGYAFSKVMGSVGYIGPIGIHPEAQGNGLAKEMLSTCVDKLKQAGCKIIGLETMPESAKHIGLYQRAGFELTFPTVSYKFPDQLIREDFHNVLNGSEIEENLLETFGQSFREEYNGYDILGDMKIALRENKENVFFYYNNERIEGVLFFCPELYRFPYGAFLKNDTNLEQFLVLCSALKKANPDTKLIIRINSKYKKAYQLQNYGFSVERGLARLTHHGYHGNYEEIDSVGFVAKAWVG